MAMKIYWIAKHLAFAEMLYAVQSLKNADNIARENIIDLEYLDLKMHAVYLTLLSIGKVGKRYSAIRIASRFIKIERLVGMDNLQSEPGRCNRLDVFGG